MEQYANDSVKFEKQKINYPNNFSIIIPKNWKWKAEDYEHENILLALNASSETDKNGFIDVISIQKIKSFGKKNDLLSEYEYCLELIENNLQNRKIVESGSSDLLNQKSYFIHVKSDTKQYGEVEIINFILESETKGVFYNLTASASQTSDLNKNMATMIQSLITFENLNK